MSDPEAAPLMAVDIGNSRIKLGVFSQVSDPGTLPLPERILRLSTHSWEPVEIALWLAPRKPQEFQWLLGSVHQGTTDSLQKWLDDEIHPEGSRVLKYDDLPITIDLKQPAAVGIDRLLAAVAANRTRPPDRSAVVIDVGTVITVDVVSIEGKFCGGAILPGVEMSAKALHDYTDQLPDLGMSELDEPPPALGTSTDEAITSGLYWGAVGAIRALIQQLNKEMSAEPYVVLTGGAAKQVADLLEASATYEEHLVLAGLAITAGSL